jgi:glycosyltransferase involved in cell wall biosynthesis
MTLYPYLVMKVKTNSRLAVRLHLTNVAGTGAIQLLESLLPALELCSHYTITEIYLPDRGALANYLPRSTSIHVNKYQRWLPNALSRFLECTLLARRFDGDQPLLVLGDLPLRCKALQTVFVQNSLLLRPTKFTWSGESIKLKLSRMIFRLNMHYASSFIVQTKLMKNALIKTYPGLRNKVYVISQPVPEWLMEKKLVRTKREVSTIDGLSLIYPAASYPHKNHKLLSAITRANAGTWPVHRLIITVSNDLNPAPTIPWISCVGFLSAKQMIQSYSQMDALLFLSQNESYGFPLVEAMFLGLPIICPDLPYARILCGEQAIYFDPVHIASLKSAIENLKIQLDAGWWPDWTKQLKMIPVSWEEVADDMLRVAVADQKKSDKDTL